MQEFADLLKIIPAKYQPLALAIICISPYITRALHAAYNGRGIKGILSGIFFGTNAPADKSPAPADPPTKTSSTLPLPLLLLTLGLALGAASVALTGCSSTPNRIAYNTVATTTTAVNAAVQGWWDYKTQFPDKVTPAQDAQVRNLYEKYQATMKVVQDAYITAGGWPSGTNAPSLQSVLNTALAAAAQDEADILALIAALKK